MLKKIFITTCALFVFMQSSFATKLLYVNNHTSKNIDFRTAAVYYLRSGCSEYTGSQNLQILIKSKSRAYIPLEVKQKDPRSAEIVLTTLPNLSSKVIIDGKETAINWVGDNIDNLDNEPFGAQRLNTSKEKYQGGHSVFLRNYRMEKIDNKQQPVIDIQFVPGDAT